MITMILNLTFSQNNNVFLHVHINCRKKIIMHFFLSENRVPVCAVLQFKSRLKRVYLIKNSPNLFTLDRNKLCHEYRYQV